jgi:anthranilate synthase component II
MLLIIDNYDSFTYNLYQFLGELKADMKVVRNDEITLEEIKELKPQGIIISPGPGRPEEAGVCIDIIKELGKEIPLLGICLGHQAIGCAYGGEVVGAEEINHGKTSRIKNNGKGLFKGLKEELTVMRYHSLVVDKNTLPVELEITSQTEDGVIMGVKHKEYPVYGLQFHPESILTESGKDMLKNFMGVVSDAERSN